LEPDRDFDFLPMACIEQNRSCYFRGRRWERDGPLYRPSRHRCGPMHKPLRPDSPFYRCRCGGRCGVLLWTPDEQRVTFWVALARTALGTAVAKTSGSLIVEISGISSGHLLIVCYAGDAGATAPYYRYNGVDTDVTFTRDVYADNSGNVITEIWSAVTTQASESGADIVTWGADAHAVACVQVTGNAASPFDKASAGTGSGTSPSSGPTATTSQADEFCIGAVGTEGPVEDASGSWATSGNGWLGTNVNGQRDGTTGPPAHKNITISEGYRIATAVDEYCALKNGIDDADWAACVATYKAETGPPPSAIGPPVGAQIV